MFEVHKLNEAGFKKAEQLQAAFKAFLTHLETTCAIGTGPHALGGREMAIVKTHLETASFYAKRAMAMQNENHTEVIG